MIDFDASTVVENVLSWLVIGILAATGGLMLAGIRRIIRHQREDRARQLEQQADLTALVSYVLVHFEPKVDEETGQPDFSMTLPFRVRRIEEELSFDSGRSVKDVLGKVARQLGVDAASGPDDTGGAV